MLNVWPPENTRQLAGDLWKDIGSFFQDSDNLMFRRFRLSHRITPSWR